MRSKRVTDVTEQMEHDVTSEDQKEDMGPGKYSGPFIPTGSTMFNLACSDSPFGGFIPGTIVHAVGDSSTGKTFQAYTMFAEINRVKEFDDYLLIHDDVERATDSINVPVLFGKSVAKRIQAPDYNKDGMPVYSDTIQDFYSNVWKLCEEGVPFVYVLDSLDSLTSDQELDRVEEMVSAHDKGKEAKGSFKAEKPKTLSEFLRVMKARLKETKSLLMIISQTRDNLEPMSYSKKTYTGGKALKFYCYHEYWLMHLGAEKSGDKTIGNKTRIRISKNRVTGKKREIDFSIFDSYGLDDIGSMVDWLVKENIWKKDGKHVINAQLKGVQLQFRRGALIDKIEDDNLEDDLREFVGDEWKRIEDSLKLDRKRKYK